MNLQVIRHPAEVYPILHRVDPKGLITHYPDHYVVASEWADSNPFLCYYTDSLACVHYC